MPSDDILDTILSENDSVTGFGNMELMRQADRLARRKAALELDARNSAQQLGLYAPQSGPITSPSFTSAVTGTQVAGPAIKRPLLGALAPLIADTARGAQEDQLDKDTSGYNRLQAAVAARVMREMPTAGDAPGPYGQPVPTQPTQQQMLAWAQRAAQIPSLAPLANAFMAEAVKLPAAQLAQRWEQYKFAAQQKLERDKLKYEQGKPVAVSQVGLFEPQRDESGTVTGYKQVPGTSPPPNYQFSSDMSQRANPRDGTVQPTGHEPPPKAYDSGTRDKLVSAGGKVADFQNLANTFKPEYTGSVGAVLKSNENLGLGKLVNDPGTAWWAEFRRLSGEIRHSQYGASLTPGEKAAFASTSIDTASDPQYVRSHLDKMLRISQAAAARTQAMADGGRLDPMTGAVVLNGQEVPGTRSPLGEREGANNNPRASGPVTDAPGSNGIPTPRTQAEFDALPKGAAFRKPGDAKVYQKK